jgi:hypothetical protein
VVNEYRQQPKAAPEVDTVDAFCRNRHVPPISSIAPDNSHSS